MEHQNSKLFRFGAVASCLHAVGACVRSLLWGFCYLTCISGFYLLFFATFFYLLHFTASNAFIYNFIVLFVDHVGHFCMYTTRCINVPRMIGFCSINAKGMTGFCKWITTLIDLQYTLCLKKTGPLLPFAITPTVLVQ